MFNRDEIEVLVRNIDQYELLGDLGFLAICGDAKSAIPESDEYSELLKKVDPKLGSRLDEVVGARLADAETDGVIIGIALGMKMAGAPTNEIRAVLKAITILHGGITRREKGGREQ